MKYKKYEIAMLVILMASLMIFSGIAELIKMCTKELLVTFFFMILPASLCIVWLVIKSNNDSDEYFVNHQKGDTNG